MQFTFSILRGFRAKYYMISTHFAGRRLKFITPVDYIQSALRNLEHVLVDCDYYRLSWITPSKGNTVLDAGAFLGFYTVSSSVLVGSDGFVYSIEPNKLVIPLLHSNISLNNALNTRIIPVAICSERGYRRLFIGEYPAVSSLTPDHVDFHGGITGYIDVKCIRLNDLLKYIGFVDILKLDVEGVEDAVLREAFNELSRVGFIIVEVHTDVVEPLDVEEVLSKAGFRDLVLYASSEMPSQVLIYARRGK
ncbi:MAG: FkbM family methyltransferase [Thermosphaera sp.]|nr:FkbM family methyltransferase [Thermosphaera sp.]